VLQAQGLESLGQLAGGVAHDFNNLLAVILSYASFVSEELATLGEVITGVQELLHRTLGEHIELITTLGDDLWPVLADPGQLEQVLVNLAVNARDAMPGGGTLTIDTSNITVDAATVYGSMAQAGGQIQIFSEPGTGTTFSITLPVTALALVPVAEPVLYHRVPKGETVLVVEDEEALRLVTQRIFARNGYHVITAADGPTALDFSARIRVRFTCWSPMW
jgi:signal transduction histidine kinase